jgi:hypothetical protein
MYAILLSIAAYCVDFPPQGEDAKPFPPMKNPAVRTIDDLKEFFDAGVAAKKPDSKNPDKITNTVYTVRELWDRFGNVKPSARHRNGDAGTECWTFECQDGTVSVTFRQRGYSKAHKTASENLRLEVTRVTEAGKSKP